MQQSDVLQKSDVGFMQASRPQAAFGDRSYSIFRQPGDIRRVHLHKYSQVNRLAICEKLKQFKLIKDGRLLPVRTCGNQTQHACRHQSNHLLLSFNANRRLVGLSYALRGLKIVTVDNLLKLQFDALQTKRGFKPKIRQVRLHLLNAQVHCLDL